MPNTITYHLKEEPAHAPRHAALSRASRPCACRVKSCGEAHRRAVARPGGQRGPAQDQGVGRPSPRPSPRARARSRLWCRVFAWCRDVGAFRRRHSPCGWPNPPEIAYWERGEWWLARDPRPWQPEAVRCVHDGQSAPIRGRLRLPAVNVFLAGPVPKCVQFYPNVYFAKITSTRLNALSTAAAGVIPFLITSACATPQSCSALT
jgi:hypothetical protein